MRSNELVARADALQREAYAILADLDLLSLLSANGRPRIVGSVALGLMTWRDIDIDLEIAGEIRADDVWATARYLLGRDEIGLVLLADDRGNDDGAHLPSMYVGAKTRMDRTGIWKIDIRFVRESDAKAGAHVERIGRELTATTRRAILCIKDAVAHDPRYGREFSGTDIYDAVLDHCIVDAEGFHTWLGGSRPGS